MTESGKKRAARYSLFLFLVLFHDISTTALASSAITTIIAPNGPRYLKIITVLTSCTATLSEIVRSYA